jgi:methionine-rich copper-binding protein CopC
MPLRSAGIVGLIFWRVGMRRQKVRFASWFVAALAILCGIATLAPRVAWAHAVLVTAQPGENSTVAGPDVAVLLKYNSRVDIAHSTLTLLAPDGKVGKIPIGSEPAPGVLSAKLTGLVKGAYELRWQVLAIDGHVTRGKVLFQIK